MNMAFVSFSFLILTLFYSAKCNFKVTGDACGRRHEK